MTVNCKYARTESSGLVECLHGALPRTFWGIHPCTHRDTPKDPRVKCGCALIEPHHKTEITPPKDLNGKEPPPPPLGPPNRVIKEGVYISQPTPEFVGRSKWW